MPHREVLEVYKKKFGVHSKNIFEWFPNGLNSVRIRFNNLEELVFTYTNEKEWRLETIGEHIKFIGRNSKA